ncbi:MAG: molybdopterin molybdotransferase MoeA [Euryarchaeota archaeon]|nr:molybdopterin molybdotransferase MoeA [Euryarchaeota archaeon]
MLKLISLGELRKILGELREEFYFRRGLEKVPIGGALGRELAEDVKAMEASPRRHIASFDGYALRAEDSGSYPLRVIGRVYAGETGEAVLQKGEAVAIATGAYLPGGTDTVLRLEDARLENGLLRGLPLEPWTKVVRAGSNYKAGETVLRKRERVRPQEVGILAGLGLEEVAVYKRPRVAVFSTGDEICRGVLRDTNGPMAMAFLREWGCDPVFLGSVPDDLEGLKAKLLEGARYDAVVTSGGVSVGEKDYLLKAIEETGKVILHKVKTRPGKPLAVGIVQDKPVFSLPGKPTGAFVALELGVRSYFLGDSGRPIARARLGEEIKLSTKDTDAPDTVNILFVLRRDGTAIPMGYERSPIVLVPRGGLYNVSSIASSRRAAVADGYVVAVRDM